MSLKQPLWLRRRFLKIGAFGATSLLFCTGFRRSDQSQSLLTPQQTEGPFFPTQGQKDVDLDLTHIHGHPNKAKGTVIKVSGRVTDQLGQPVALALIDVWQANSYGKYHHELDQRRVKIDENFQGWGTIQTDDDGYYHFLSIKPGPYPADGKWMRPPHVHFKVAKRGYRELTTQMYFSGESLNQKDLLLLELSEQEQKLLIVDFEQDSQKQYLNGRFDIVLSKIGIDTA
ncbi:protocatechuate 3,4-dioxygenase [Thalassotalea litorea]|uniref:Protocatechuate 3,4-dioxygenase n=1 Tax=Thalassotalea litorea TaxID=2020715 RepID=A0A5R9IGS6_9GAMM|nr:protocatechuate 3,4-dioxygenase [Thalassotalea litorea]TLU61348.1 protocatechuate 3,4-dioxygenase [Thalassotalea litorea]